ncbi:MAG: T9SS type A sorting domain-containing protein [Bacteroidia bacterium]|nr:T9SS type A sorting domain-containing protein [Bacteroidia bacterium]
MGSIGEYSVSGTVTLDGLPLEGVLVDFETITSDPVTASDGTYTCMVPTGWYGDITPALAGYIFTPEYLHLSAVSSNISGKDFAAAEVSFTISGTVAEGGVPIEGVDVTFENTTKDILQVVTTASDGTYSCDVPYNWSGTATPSKTDYTFDPESKSYTNVLADVSDEDYEGYSGGLPPGWGYVNTGSNHTLFVQATAPKIDGVPLSYGSWIGVFYDDNGVEKCAGAIEWQGASSPIIAAQGDDSTTPEKDGFSEGETITFKFYINDLKGTALYAAPTYASGPQVYTTNGATVTSLLAAYTSITQVVPLIEGWSGISSYILPDNDSTAIIFAPVVSDLVILKSMTLAFWPPNINQIVHWNTYEGYKLKMINNQQVLFTGQDSEKTFTIPEGWSLLPVLSNQNVDVSSIFSSVLNDIIIIKSIDGMGVYWPSVGVQTLTSLTPGESYMAKFSAQSTITFPPLASKAGSVVKGYSDPVNSDIWSMPLNTGITHTLAFSEQASEIFETGDLLGVFDVNDRCVGIAEVSEGHTPVVSVYGDDQTTIEKDGMFHNEAFVLKVYHVETETIDEILVEYDKQYNIAYCDNGMSVIVKTTSTTGIGSMNLEYTRVFPNPATDKLYIHVPGGDNVDFNVRILSANGGSVLAEKTFSGRTTLNIQPLPAGVYMIEITDGISAPVVKRIIKN